MRFEVGLGSADSLILSPAIRKCCVTDVFDIWGAEKRWGFADVEESRWRREIHAQGTSLMIADTAFKPTSSNIDAPIRKRIGPDTAQEDGIVYC